MDKRFLDELRSRLTLSDVIGKRLKLTRAGREFKGCCPFHNEKTPSFYINDAKGFFHCFGCGAHGDAVTFRMRHDNLPFIEAVESLCGEAGLSMPVSDPHEAERYNEMQRLQLVMERACKWFETQLRHPTNGFALRYVRERGISDETIAQFRIGYAPNNWDALREAMIACDITIEDMVILGLLKKSTREDKADSKPYSFFRGRILFPVTDSKGRVIAFGGRHLDAAFAGQTLTDKPPKYLNSSEHLLFNKSSVLYGLARARMTVSATAPLILVEGYMDVVSLVQAGFQTAVAPLGTALTEEHITLAWKASHPDAPPILCFDGDNAGQAAAYRALDRILPHVTAQRGLRLAFLPKGEDPDSLIRTKGISAMQAVLDQSIGLFDAMWQQALATNRADTPEGRAKIELHLKSQISSIKDPILQQNYRQTLRDQLFHLGRASSNKGKPQGKSGSRFPAPVAIKKMDTNPETVGWQVCLAVLVNHPFILQQHVDSLASHEAPTPELNQLREALVDLATAQPPDSTLTPEDVRIFLSSRELNPILSSLNHHSLSSGFGFTKPEALPEQALEGWKDVWTRMQRKSFAQDKTHLLQEIKTHLSDDDIHRLMMLSEQEHHLNLDDNF